MFQEGDKEGVFYIYLLLSLFFPLIWLIRRYINVSFVRKKCDVGRRRVPERNCADTDIIQPLCWGYHTTRNIILGISYYSKYHAGDILLLEISCWGYNTTLCTDIIQPPGQLNHVSCIMYNKGICICGSECHTTLRAMDNGYHASRIIIRPWIS